MEKGSTLVSSKTPILIVEDDSFFRSVLRKVLNTVGFQNITEADSGRTATALLPKNKFEIIISDVQMPFVNGLQLLQHIRSGQTPAPRDTRLILLTSFSNTETLGVALALDVNGFLAKPIKPNDIASKIRSALGETMHLRPELAYKSVNTNFDILTTKPVSAALIPEGSENPPRPNKQSISIPIDAAANPSTGTMARNFRQVPILQLTPGGHIAKDVHFKNGTLLLSAGVPITQFIINRLRELRLVLKGNSVWISD